MSFTARTLFVVGLVGLLAGCSSQADASQPATTVQKTLSVSHALPTGTAVEVENMLGHVVVRQGSGQLKVKATVVAGGKDHATAAALADTIQLNVRKHDGKLVVHVHYPVDKHDTYRYVQANGSKDHESSSEVSIFGFHLDFSSSHSSFHYQHERVSAYRGSNHGVALHVNLVVMLPPGSKAEIENHVGLTEAKDVHASLDLESDSGNIHAEGITGSLDTDTGSGDVTASNIQGPFSADTGSGNVSVQGANGNVDIDVGSGNVKASALHGNTLKLEAGSGNIHASKLQGSELKLETGSGNIHVDGLQGGKVKLDAGSGNIHASGVSGAVKLETGSGNIRLQSPGAITQLKVDAGSGDVVVSGNLAQLQHFDIETGSGDVTLTTQQPPAVHLAIDGSDIRVDWPHLANVHSSEGHFSGDVGSATGKGTISTGSGDVVLSQ